MWWSYGVVFGFFAVLPVLLIYVLYSGLRGDPAKGRRRCRKCWHSLDGIEPVKGIWTCPECGVPCRNESKLYPRRRYWWRIVVGLLGLLAQGGWFYGKIVVERWGHEQFTALVPSTLLVPFYPKSYEPFERGDKFMMWVDEVLVSREDELWGWQASMLPELEFTTKAPDLQNAVILPDTWVEGLPVPVSVDVEHMTQVPSFAVVTVHDIYGKELIRTSGQQGYLGLALPRAGVLPAFEFAGEEQGFELVHTTTVWGTLVGGESRHSEWVTLEGPKLISLEEAANGVFTTPVINKLTDDAIGRMSWLWISVQPGQVGIRPNEPYTGSSDLPEIDFACTVEIFDGEEVIFAYDSISYWNSRDIDGYNDRHARSLRAIVRILGADDDECRANLDRMRVRILPNLEKAVLHSRHSRYWMPANERGYLEMSLREALNGRMGATKGEAPLFTFDADSLRTRASLP